MKSFPKIVILCSLLYSSAFAQVTSYHFDPAKIDKVLAGKLDSLHQEDQKCRLEMSKLNAGGAPKKVIDSIKAIIKIKDSSNLVLATQLIGKYGWLGPQEVGFLGTQALFLIIQHADLKTQKKYYPMIRQAEREGKILSSNVAIMEDRIAVREGKAQTYGSQAFYDESKKKTYVYPLQDVDNLDQLRKSRGLSPMQEYLKNWSVETYRTDLPYATALLIKLKTSNKP